MQLVITAIGPDRPGLVDKFTGYLHDTGANIADARMVNLRGQFAMILLAEADDQAAQTIRSGAMEAGREAGLNVSVAAETAAGHALPAGLPYRLRAFAMDQPGIVHRITHLLHRHNVNIEELSTTLEAGAFTGTPLFTMELRLTLPTGLPVKKLRQEIEALCDTLNCDADLQPA